MAPGQGWHIKGVVPRQSLFYTTFATALCTSWGCFHGVSGGCETSVTGVGDECHEQGSPAPDGNPPPLVVLCIPSAQTVVMCANKGVSLPPPGCGGGTAEEAPVVTQ